MLQVIEFKTQTSKLKVQADLRLKIQPQTFHPKPFTLNPNLSTINSSKLDQKTSMPPILAVNSEG
jgi:hypothetical protein